MVCLFEETAFPPFFDLKIGLSVRSSCQIDCGPSLFLRVDACRIALFPSMSKAYPSTSSVTLFDCLKSDSQFPFLLELIMVFSVCCLRTDNGSVCLSN